MTYFTPNMKILVIHAVASLLQIQTSAFTRESAYGWNTVRQGIVDSSLRLRVEKIEEQTQSQSQAQSQSQSPAQSKASIVTTPTTSSMNASETLAFIGSQFESEVSVLVDSVKTAVGFIQSKNLAKDIAAICDEIDTVNESKDDDILLEKFNTKEKSLRFARRMMLANLMKEDYETYITTAEFLSPGRIPRSELPNVQDVKFTNGSDLIDNVPLTDEATGLSLVADCELDTKQFEESLLDKILLKVFRNLVVKETDGIGVSDKPDIEGLLEQGRKYMLKPNQTAGVYFF